MEDMEKKKARKHRYYLRHKEEINLKRKLYYQIHKERCKNLSRRWAKEHLEHRRELSRTYQKKLKEKTHHLLGNKCSNPNCPIPIEIMNIHCLQIDHVNGGGLKEYKKSKNSYSYYKNILVKIQSGSTDYQLLCVYCNWLKRMENNETPNKREQLNGI